MTTLTVVTLVPAAFREARPVRDWMKVDGPGRREVSDAIAGVKKRRRALRPGEIDRARRARTRGSIDGRIASPPGVDDAAVHDAGAPVVVRFQARHGDAAREGREQRACSGKREQAQGAAHRGSG